MLRELKPALTDSCLETACREIRLLQHTRVHFSGNVLHIDSDDGAGIRVTAEKEVAYCNLLQEFRLGRDFGVFSTDLLEDLPVHWTVITVETISAPDVHVVEIH